MLPLWHVFLVWVSALSAVTASTCSENHNIEFYRNYNTSECPPIFHLDGLDCQATDPMNPLHKDHDLGEDWYPLIHEIGGFCDSYCPVATEYTYGQEQPIDTKALCRGPVTCHLSKTERPSYSFPIKLPNAPTGYHKPIMDIGIDGGYNPTSGDAASTSRELAVELKQGECGYWTFLPYVKHTCGTYTLRDHVWSDFEIYVKDCENTRSVPNVCAVQPLGFDQEPLPGQPVHRKRSSIPRDLRGWYMFVPVDCYTGQKLARALQSPEFSHEGVAIPDDSTYWKTLTKHWEYMTDRPEWRQYDETFCRWSNKRNDLFEAFAPPADCVDAIASLRESADLVFTSNKLTTVAKYGNCLVSAQLDKNANIPDCQYTYLELAIAADIGRRSCSQDFKWCPAYPLYDKHDGCHGWITVSSTVDGDAWDCW